MAKRNLREEAKLLRDINKETNDLLSAEKKLDSTYEKRQNLLSDLESSMGDINDLKKVEKDLDDEINRLNESGHTSLAQTNILFCLHRYRCAKRTSSPHLLVQRNHYEQCVFAYPDSQSAHIIKPFRQENMY